MPSSCNWLLPLHSGRPPHPCHVQAHPFAAGEVILSSFQLIKNEEEKNGPSSFKVFPTPGEIPCLAAGSPPLGSLWSKPTLRQVRR